MKLEGLTVVDLSMFLPGPHLTMMMRDHGARVISVEPPAGEPTRSIGPRQGGTTVYYRQTCRGKESLCLNLKDDASREAFLRLCDHADVVVEGFRPGVVERLGIDYPTVSERNPAIVYCSLSAHGQTGPDHDKPAHDLSIQAVTGLVSVNLDSDGEPVQPGVPAADMAASLMAFGAIMAALYRRCTTGRGDYVDIAMHDALLSWTANAVGTVFAEKRAPTVKHERTWGGGALYRIYRTRDGRHITLGGQEMNFVRNLLGALGGESFIPLCERGPGPHQAPLVEWLQERFAERTQDQWVEWFEGRDICFAPVKDLLEAYSDPQARARDMYLRDENGNEHIGVPIKFADEPGAPEFRLSDKGQDNAGILQSLDYDDDQIAAIGATAGLTP